MSVRIGSGKWRGRVLQTPPGPATRPTLARVRKSLLDTLAPWIAGGRVLDMFCGAGALGIEALSRGAAHATLVEQSREAAAALRGNLQLLGAAGGARVVEGDALLWCAQDFTPGSAPYDAIVLDPPYGCGLADAALNSLAARPEAWLAVGGSIAAQVGRADALADNYGPWKRLRTKDYGETRIDFYGWTD